MADRLVHCVRRGDLPGVHEMVDSGVDVNDIDYDGMTVLMHAVRQRPENIEIVEALLNLGADVKIHDRVEKATALHLAAELRNGRVAHLLVSAGADVNAEDIRGNTPLGRCILSSSRSRSTYDTLIALGADQEKKNNYGISAAEVLADVDETSWQE